MPGAPYDPAAKLQVHVVSQSPHTFAYKLWVAAPGEARWTALDTGNIETPEKEYGPFSKGTKIAYTLLIAGNPNTDWKTQVMLSQRGALLNCSPPPETGITTVNGAARRDTAVVLQ
jgi:hypothetical protein